jgi:hypothetical protein
VVGTGRCGTVYFAKLLSSIGIPCSHERIFTPEGLKQNGTDSDVARWSGLSAKQFVLAEASYMAVPYLQALNEAIVIHAVRDPINVILSFNNKLQYWHHSQNKWEKFILSHLPEIENYKNPLVKNCCYVVRWNQWIEDQSKNRSYIRIRLEYDEDKLLDFLKIPTVLRPKLDPANTHEEWKDKKPPLAKPATSEDIMNGPFGLEIEDLRKKYNYEM